MNWVLVGLAFTTFLSTLIGGTFAIKLRKALPYLAREKEKGTITLLYSAKDEEHNQAVALSAVLRKT